MEADLDTAPFWAASAEHRLVYTQCRRCSTVIFYPRRHCTRCTEGDVAWRESAGLGTIYSITVVRRSADPRLRDLVPYTIAYIDLDEGFRMMSRVRGADLASMTIGARVRVAWEDFDGHDIPVFELAGR